MLQDGHRPETVVLPDGDEFRSINFDLCRAVNRLALPGILDRMVDLGMPKEQADLFNTMSAVLLQLMRTENNRLYAARQQAALHPKERDHD